MDNADFIEVYDGALDARACRELIARFDASGQAVRGATGGGVDTKLKDNWDICISEHPEWQDVESRFNTVLLRAVMAYVRKYAYAALAPMTLRMPDPKTGELCLLYTSPSPRDRQKSRMPSSA